MRPSTVFTYSQQTNHTIPSLNEDTNLQILDTVLDRTGSLFGFIWHPSCMLRGSKSLRCSIVLLHHENGKTYAQYNHHNNLTKRWKALRETTTCTFLGCRMQGICKWCKRQRYKMTFRNKLRSLMTRTSGRTQQQHGVFVMYVGNKVGASFCQSGS
jgi:hypothetical protein